MSLACPFPFLYGELKGTPWYSRFIVEEYYIRLNHAPDRYVVRDKELKVPSNAPRFAFYKRLITNYFLDSSGRIDSLSPWEILLDLRKIKSDLFSPEEIITFSETDTRGKTYDPDDWVSLVKENLSLRCCLQKAWIQPGLKQVFDRAEKIMLFPGKRENFKHDIQTWLYPWRGKRLLLVVFNNPLYRGVDRAFAEKVIESSFRDMSAELIENISIPPEETWIEYLRNFIGSGGVIVTTGIWSYYSLFKIVSPFVFVLDNREWIARTLFQSSFYPQSVSPWIATSALEKYLIKEEDLSVEGHPFQVMAAAGVQERRFPEEVDLTGTQYTSLSLFEFLAGKTPRSFDDRLVEDISFLENISNKYGFRVLTGFYRVSKDEIEKCSKDEPGAVLVNGVLCNENQIKATPILSGNLYSPYDLYLEGSGFLTSFNYYFTKNLTHIYNSSVAPSDAIKTENIFIDYLGLFYENRAFESVPLYNKGFLGCTKKGEVFAAYLNIASVSLEADRVSYIFTPDQINRASKNCNTSLYLPCFSENYVGAGKYCLSIVQDVIIYSGPGPCRIPPFGVVVTSNDPFPSDLKGLKWSVEFRDLPVPKSRLSWLFGGFNLLVVNGRNLYRTYVEAENALKREGWYHPQSRLTQETQLVPGERQPRAVFGRTSNGKIILLTFSGRTEISRGVTFSESVLFASRFIENGENFDFLVNLDGGASSFFMVFDNGEKKLLSMPAPSSENPAGVPRPVPSVFLLKLKNPMKEMV
ncbi:MAG: hypothetical protein DRP87_17280 [Spirochaetes bacterium]|nr:MAG: hypothetical protein DRP87_17280 [Spirochaetota bacterium]